MNNQNKQTHENMQLCQACKPKTLCCVQAHGEIRLAGRMKAYALGDNNNSGSFEMH